MNADLEARLKRLMVFRVVMVTTLLFIATYVEAVSETLLHGQSAVLRDRRDVRADGHARDRAVVPALRRALAHAQVRGRPVDGDGARLRDRWRAHRLPAAVPAVGALRDDAGAAAGCARSRAWPPRSTGALLAAVRAGLLPPAGTRGTGDLPPLRPALLGVRAGRRLRHGGAARLVPGREPAARGQQAAARRRSRSPTCAASTR